MKPLVTIAIPTYQRFAYLKEAVASALVQDYKKIEVLIGQDPSSHGLNVELQNWILRQSEYDARVKCFFNDRNLGLAGNWNALAAKAEGEYIMIIGDDDRLLPYTVDILVQSILPDRNVAFSNHYLINEKGERLEKESVAHTRDFHREHLASGILINPSKVIWQNAVPMSAALIKTEDIRRLRFKEDLNTPEIEFYLRLAGEGGKFCFVPDYTMEYRVHLQSATHEGLHVHKLLNYLISIPADEESLPFKIKFIEGLIGPAVNKFLEEGDLEKARSLYTSGFYSGRLKYSVRGMVHATSFLLPETWGKAFFNFCYRFK